MLVYNIYIFSYIGAPSFLRLAEDEFLAMFICRYIFCYATLSQHKPSVAHGPDCMPASNPLFPESFFANKDVLSVVHKLAALFGVSVLFNSTSSVLLPRARSPVPHARHCTPHTSKAEPELSSPSFCPLASPVKPEAGAATAVPPLPPSLVEQPEDEI